MNKFIAAATLMSALALVPAHAGSSESESKQKSSGDMSAQEQTPTKKGSAARPKGELERCKKEARGLRGPERGDFMTECLKRQ